MSRITTVDFRADLAPFQRVVAEILTLVRKLGPEGLELLREFTAREKGGFSIGNASVMDGVATVAREASPVTLAFLEDLRRRVGQ